MSNVIDSVIIFRILKKLTTPWEKTGAFKSGLIDKNGKVIVKKKDRTPEMKKNYTLLDRLVFNLKRLMSRIPGGGGQIASYVAALALIKEYVEKESNTATSELLIEKFEEHGYAPKGLKEYDLSTQEGFMDAFEDALMGEMVSGAALGGSLSGAGDNETINKTGMAGKDPVLGKKKRRIEKVLQNRL